MYVGRGEISAGLSKKSHQNSLFRGQAHLAMIVVPLSTYWGNPTSIRQWIPITLGGGWNNFSPAADSEHEEELVAILQRLSHFVSGDFLSIDEEPYLGPQIALLII